MLGEIIAAIIIGIIAGYLGRLLLPVILGIVGSLVGYFLFTKVPGIGDDDKIDLGGIIGAIIGTMLVLLVWRAVAGRSDRTAGRPV